MQTIYAATTAAHSKKILHATRHGLCADMTYLVVLIICAERACVAHQHQCLLHPAQCGTRLFQSGFMSEKGMMCAERVMAATLRFSSAP